MSPTPSGVSSRRNPRPGASWPRFSFLGDAEADSRRRPEGVDFAISSRTIPRMPSILLTGVDSLAGKAFQRLEEVGVNFLREPHGVRLLYRSGVAESVALILTTEEQRLRQATPSFELVSTSSFWMERHLPDATTEKNFNP